MPAGSSTTNAETLAATEFHVAKQQPMCTSVYDTELTAEPGLASILA